MNRRAQSAIEFVGLIMFMFLVFFAFFFVIQSQIVETTEKRDVELLGSLNNIVVSQLHLAWTSNADFSHEFELPVLANNYVISLPDSYEVVATLDDKEYVDFLPFAVRNGTVLPPGQIQTVYYDDGWYLDNSNTRKYDSRGDGLFLNVPGELCVAADSTGNCGNVAYISNSDVFSCQTLMNLC